MQHKNRDGGGKCFSWKGQRGRITLHHRAVCAAAALRDAERKRMAVLKTRHSLGAPSQLFCGRAWACAEFENVVAQLRVAQEPWKQLLPSHVAPERRRAEPILEAIHSGATDLARTQACSDAFGLEVLTFLKEQFVLRI